MEDLNFLHSTYDELPGGKKPSAPRIVLVEDDKVLAFSIQKFLQKTLGVGVHVFNSGNACLDAVSRPDYASPFCFVTDISLESGGPDGLLLIDILRERGLDFVPIVMTGFASVESAIAATKKGAFHYLTKPFELQDLHDLVVKAMAEKFSVQLGQGMMAIQEQSTPASSNDSALDRQKRANTIILGKFKIELPRPGDMFAGMVGRSLAMKDVFARIQKVANSDSTVLISGPSGTGKELVARAIHDLSSRRTENMVSVNCGAIPSELLESELFGHMKGAFTGAISNRVGRFELANEGTIFLDEIGDMPLLLQVKLLRVIQGRQIEPVGGSHPRDVDVRILAATHRDLEKYVAEGKFRDDLYYRLNVIPIKIPALKERREDIPLLIAHFLSKFVSASGSNAIEFPDDTLELIMTYDWPGNVRELENVIERLVILRGGNPIRPEDLPAKIYRNNPLATSLYKTIFDLPSDGLDLKQVVSDIEDALILQALERTGGNKNQASKLLQMNRTTLIEKMKKKGLPLDLF